MLRILAVDDNCDSADALVALLGLESYEAKAVYSGQTAIDLMDNFLPDVVFMDIAMPVMDGYQAARMIRRTPRLANLRLVALTGYGKPSDIRRCAMAGFDHHLLKPTHFSDILIYLRQVPCETGT